MVYYFISNVVSPPSTLFMGLDKYESAFLDLHFYFYLLFAPINMKMY